MAKVMISIPDALLERVDRYVEAAGETRSGFLQRLAEEQLSAEDAKLREEFERLLGPPIDLGVDPARLIREDRESH